MELICLFCLYYLSQNPQFAESVKPLMTSLQNSEQMLKFINDLSKFSAFFSSNEQPHSKKSEPKQQSSQEEQGNFCKSEQTSPTAGVAGDFIEQVLSNYFKNRQ